MNLPQGDKWRKRALAAGYGSDESATITLDGLMLIRCRETKIKLCLTAGLRYSPNTCTEAMHQV